MAGHLGKSVAETKDVVDSREFTAWQAYHTEIEPIGDRRIDYLFAMLMHVVASCHTDKKTRLKLETFIPEWRQKTQAEHSQEVAQKISVALGQISQDS